MEKPQSASALRHLRTLFAVGTTAGLSDSELLRRFAERRAEAAEAGVAAEAAFAALVDRHGPMVWGVCRRILSDRHEAEDAFQATFLVLVRKAGSVRVDDSLGRWLYGVARRVAGRAHAQERRRRTLPAPAAVGAGIDPARELEIGDLRAALDAELGRLPPECRDPVELCDLQGLSHEEVARRLGCAARTVRSRLSRGRERLRERLSRRGFAPALLGLAEPGPKAPPAAAPPALVRSTIRSAVLAAAGRPGAFPAAAAALANGAIRAMILSKLKLGALAAGLGLVVTGAGAYAMQREASDAGPENVALKPDDANPTRTTEERRSETSPLRPEVEELARAIEEMRDPREVEDALRAVRRLTQELRSGPRRARAGAYPQPLFRSENHREAVPRPPGSGFGGGKGDVPGPQPKGVSDANALPKGVSDPNALPKGVTDPNALPKGVTDVNALPKGVSDPTATPKGASDPRKRPMGEYEAMVEQLAPPAGVGSELSESLRDQDRRLRRLEALLERLLNERRSAPPLGRE